MHANSVAKTNSGLLSLFTLAFVPAGASMEANRGKGYYAGDSTSIQDKGQALSYVCVVMIYDTELC